MVRGDLHAHFHCPDDCDVTFHGEPFGSLRNDAVHAGAQVSFRRFKEKRRHAACVFSSPCTLRSHMIRETFPVGLLQCNCTILGDEQSREAIVVDPGYDIPRILTTLAKHQLTVRQIVVTHAHIDHIASALELKQITGAPILYNAADLPLIAMMDEQAAWIGVETPI